VTTGGAGGASGKTQTSGKGGSSVGTAGKGLDSKGSAGAGGSRPYTCPSTSTLKAGDTNGSVTVDGQERTYILHVPGSYNAKTPVPLIFDWHPIQTNGAYEQGYSAYQSFDDEKGIITVFPDGIQGAFNVGPCCTQSREVDDVGFARAMVKKISSEGCIDPKRIYSVGYSMGGGISHYLACHAADVFAAVAPAAFDFFEENATDCKPTRPITVIAFRGTADLFVPYEGGTSNPPTAGYTLPQMTFIGAVKTFEKWAELDGCTGSPVDNVAGPGCKTYIECKAGVEVTLCTTQGGGHVGGDPNVAWPMLSKHPMP
jgi:polyhydroxybutyrate depolymerase